MGAASEDKDDAFLIGCEGKEVQTRRQGDEDVKARTQGSTRTGENATLLGDLIVFAYR